LAIIKIRTLIQNLIMTDVTHGHYRYIATTLTLYIFYFRYQRSFLKDYIHNDDNLCTLIAFLFGLVGVNISIQGCLIDKII